MTAAATKSLAEQAEKLVPQMRPGFVVLADLTGLQSMALGCVPHVSRIMELCKTHGSGTTIRVIPGPKKDIGLTILANIRHGTAVPILIYSNLAEAEAAIKSPARTRDCRSRRSLITPAQACCWLL